jgi:hypothetical protein
MKTTIIQIDPSCPSEILFEFLIKHQAKIINFELTNLLEIEISSPTLNQLISEYIQITNLT